MTFGSVYACELTEEFVELRKEAYQEIRSAFNACQESVRAYHYWDAYAACVEAKGDALKGSKCAHAFQQREPLSEVAFQHCEVLRPNEEQAEEYVATLMAEREVARCEGEREP